MKKYRWIIPVFLSVFGCAESDMKMAVEMDTSMGYSEDIASMNDDAEYAADADVNDSYFIDVYPSDSIEGVLPQTLKVTQNELYHSRIVVDLQPTVSIFGYISGYQIFPTSESLPPGEHIPLIGNISIEKKDFLNKSTTRTDESGYFEMELPRSSNYQFKIVPDNSAEIPFFVENIDVSEMQSSFDYELTPGIPVFGFLQFEDMNGLLWENPQEIYEHIEVRIQDGNDGIISDPLFVSEDGFFSIRAPDYVDEIDLLLSSTDPSLAFPNYTFRYRLPEDGLFIEEILPAPVSNLIQGQLIAPEGIALEDRVTIRFTSIELYHSNGEIMDGSIVVETNNDVNGYFSVNLPMGRYQIEVIPDYNPDELLGSTSLIVDIEQATNLGRIQMSQKQKFSATIRNMQDFPLQNAQVAFRDLYFDHFVYTTTTDAQGKLDMFLPKSDFEVVILPSDLGTPIARRKLSLNAELDETLWTVSQGKEVQGSILYNGESLPYALVEIRDLYGILASGISGSDGQFSLNIEEVLFQ